jgi:hypothetical protein
MATFLKVNPARSFPEKPGGWKNENVAPQDLGCYKANPWIFKEYLVILCRLPSAAKRHPNGTNKNNPNSLRKIAAGMRQQVSREAEISGQDSG